MNKYLKILLTVGILFISVSLIMSGCSRQPVNNEQPVRLEISFDLSGMHQADQADVFRLTVTGVGIVRPIVTDLVLVEGILTGRVEIPAGPERLFVIEIFDELGNVIYSGRTVADVEPGLEVKLSIDLFPQVALIRVSPVYIQKPQGATLALSVKIYNLLNLNSINVQLENADLSGFFSWGVDSVVRNPGLGTAVLLDSVNYGDFSVSFSIHHRLDQYRFVDDSGYAELATVYYSTFSLDALVDTFYFKPTVIGTRDDSGVVLPGDNIRAEGSTVELYDLSFHTMANWVMNDNDNVIRDVQNGLDGTAYGTMITEGVFGLARIFNGEGDYIEVPHDPLLNIDEAITISFWVRPDTLLEPGTVISKREADGPINYQLTTVYTASDSVVNFFFEYGLRPETYRVRVGNIIDNEWHHVAVSYMFGKPSSMLFVVDGQIRLGEWFNSEGDQPAPLNDQPLQIGRRLGSNQFFYDGSIDEVSLFDVALDYEIILQLLYWQPM